MRRIEIQVGSKSVFLETADFDDTIDVDDLTSIHYGNLAGEAITIPVILNRIGLLKVEAEKLSKKAKMNAEIFESQYKRDLRREASANSNFFRIDGERIKLSEKSLDEAVKLNEDWQAKYNERLDAEESFSFMDILYWSISEKSKKLDVLLKGVQQDDLENLIDTGYINGMFVDVEELKIVNRNN